MTGKAKRGRPQVDIPKKYMLSMRLTEEEEEILSTYAKTYGVSRADAGRIAIKELSKELPGYDAERNAEPYIQEMEDNIIAAVRTGIKKIIAKEKG